MALEAETEVTPIPRTPIKGNYWLAWLIAWLGIALSGGIFGLCLGGGIGFLAGLVIAGVYGLPIIATVAVLTWAFWLMRWQLISATIAGACTGIASTALMVMSVGSPFSEDGLLIFAAGSLGGFGGGIASYIYWQKRSLPAPIRSSIGWQFSLRDLFLRFTVLAVLIAGWSFAITAIVKSSVK